jgi:hypothetical protein
LADPWADNLKVGDSVSQRIFQPSSTVNVLIVFDPAPLNVMSKAEDDSGTLFSDAALLHSTDMNMRHRPMMMKAFQGVFEISANKRTLLVLP